MQRLENSLYRSIGLVILVLCVAGPISGIRTAPGQDLEKKYAAIIGDYEFDWGQGAITLQFYIKDGELWADSGDGRPAVMKSVDGEVFTFTAEDPVEGVFRIKFDKDEQGEYTICQVANEAAGMEITGKKIK
jgi:hypothetical protein